MTNLVDVPGVQNTTQAFRDKVVAIADDVRTDPNFLMAIMSFETGGSFSPSTKNLAGSGAVGLIQFMPKTAKNLGTTSTELAQMTPRKQLDFVRDYFLPFKGRLATIQDCYMAVLMPNAIGKGPDHILFKQPSKAFEQNSGLDSNGDGNVTVAEATSKVEERLGAPLADEPVLRRGDEGPDVSILQDEMVDLGYLTLEEVATGPGIFGPRTERAVTAFQADLGLASSGAFDLPAQLAIRQLNSGVGRGSQGGVVGALQQRLVTRRFMTRAEVATGPGIFGPKTQRSLIRFQLKQGLNPTGVLSDETFRALFKEEALVDFDRLADNTTVNVVLPESGRGFATFSREMGGRDQVGTERTINALVAIAHAWAMEHPEVDLQFGDISRPGGGPFPPHKTHRDGRDVDMRPIRKDNALRPIDISSSAYDPKRTADFVKLLRAQHPNIKILFNDPKLVSAGLTRKVRGHDNHLHLRFS